MKELLVIEDGGEYAEFARLFLGAAFSVRAAHDAREALAALAAHAADALLVDLRFDRAPSNALVGDIDATAARLFGGDRARAESYLKDHQGALVLGELRRAGHRQLALFIHAFPPAQLLNLQKLYAPVQARAELRRAGRVARARGSRVTHAAQATDAEACALALRLAHDVGKHAARAAHNIAAGAAVPVAVADMLVGDLYALGGEHASACFARLAAPLRTARHDARLEHCAALLSEVDALESAVRARDAGALARAAQCALEVEALLLAVARAHCAEP